MFRSALVTFFATLALCISVPVASAATLVPVVQVGASSPQRITPETAQWARDSGDSTSAGPRRNLYFAYKVKITNAVPKAGDDALTASRFGITVDGYEIDLGGWSKVEGLKVTFESPRQVVLGRSTSTSTRTNLEIVAWHEAVARDVVIVAYGANGQPLARYYLENAWPSKIELGLKSGGPEVSHESVTLVCEDIHRVSP